MREIALRFAEDYPIIATIYLMAITVGLMSLMAYHQNTLTSWSRSTLFWLSTLWSVIVLLDVIGAISVFGSSLPQVVNR